MMTVFVPLRDRERDLLGLSLTRCFPFTVLSNTGSCEDNTPNVRIDFSLIQ